MKILPRILCLLLAISFAWALPEGRPATRSALLSQSVTPLRTVQDSMLTLLRHDGTPAWNWPDLPGAEVRYRKRVTVPSDCRLLAYELAAFGGESNDDTPQRSTRLRLLRLDETVIHEADSLVLHATGDFERVELEEPLLLGAGEYLIELRRPTGQVAPWLAADDDCEFEGTSSIAVTGVTNGFQTVEHDLNLRLLIRYLVDDQVPQTQLPVFDTVSWAAGLSVMLRACDESGIDTAWVELELPDQRTAGLAALPVDDDVESCDWRTFSGILSLSNLVPSPDSLLIGSFFVRDTLNHTAELPFELTLSDIACFDYAGGFPDEYRYPMYPPVGGDAFAVLLNLENVAEDLGSLSATLRGLRMLSKGIGSTTVYLFADDNGVPARTSVGDTLLTAAIASVVPCPGWNQLDFDIAAGDTLQELDKIWLMLVPEAISEGQALFFESIADTSQESDCYVYHPLEGTFSQLEGVQPCLRVVLGAEACEYEDSLRVGVGDSDFTFRCWQRNPLRNDREGWFSSAEFAPDTVYFAPSNELADPNHIQSGSFAVINSDMNPGFSQHDTLFTPWITLGEPMSLDFLSCYGEVLNSANGAGEYEDASVLLCFKDTEQDMELVLASEDIFQLDSIAISDQLVHPRWIERSWSGSLHGSGEIRIGFAYSGAWAYGWAIDEVRITGALPEQFPAVFDGPQVAEVELGRLYPNPFNPVAQIPYRVREGGPVRISVHNLLGQQIALLLDDKRHSSGNYIVSWEPQGVASGLYLVHLQSAGHQEVKRILFLK